MIKEVCKAFGFDVALIFPAGTYRFYILGNKLSYIQLELAFQPCKADVYRSIEVDFILQFTLSVLINDYRVCNSGTEVIHHQSCKYLLLYR